MGMPFEVPSRGLLLRTAGAGIFYHVFDSSDKIKEIYFLRQLQHDEAERKVLVFSVKHIYV